MFFWLESKIFPQRSNCCCNLLLCSVWASMYMISPSPMNTHQVWSQIHAQDPGCYPPVFLAPIFWQLSKVKASLVTRVTFKASKIIYFLPTRGKMQKIKNFWQKIVFPLFPQLLARPLEMAFSKNSILHKKCHIVRRRLSCRWSSSALWWSCQLNETCPSVMSADSYDFHYHWCRPGCTDLHFKTHHAFFLLCFNTDVLWGTGFDFMLHALPHIIKFCCWRYSAFKI